MVERPLRFVTAASLFDAAFHEGQRRHAVGVRGDGDARAKLFRHAALRCGEIETVRLGVELQPDAALGGGAHHPFDVKRVRLALENQAAGGVTQDAAGRVVEGAEDARGLLGGR